MTIAIICVCRCWVGPVVHLLFKDPVLSDFLLSKDLSDEPTSVPSQLLVLVDQLVQRSQAVDLEALLDALALSFQDSSGTLLSRLRADGHRKAKQTQLEWSAAAQFLLDALTSSPASTYDDQVAFRTICFPRLPIHLLCTVQAHAVLLLASFGWTPRKSSACRWSGFPGSSFWNRTSKHVASLSARRLSR